MDNIWLSEACSTLELTIANILQVPQKEISSFSNRVSRAVAVKAGGAATAAGILGLVSTFGTASTGTAIASLSGAAASNASLYWVGSIIGGGVWIGGILTGGVGIAAAILAMKAIMGKQRAIDKLTDEEQGIINAALALAKVFREQIELNKAISLAEAQLVNNEAWMPLTCAFKSYLRLRSYKTVSPVGRWHLLTREHEYDELSKRLRSWLARADACQRT